MNAKTDTLTGIAVLAGIGALYTTGLPPDDGMAMSIAMDPAWYPWLLLLLASLCAAGLVLAPLFRRSAASEAGETIRLRPVVAGLIAICLYVLAFWYLGYWVATLLFVPVFGLGLGYRRPLVVGIVTLLVTGGVWLVFTQALQIPLRTWPW